MAKPVRVPLVQGAYTARSYIAAAQRCLNLYPEKNPQGEDSQTTHYLRAGLSRLGVPAQAATVRALYRATNGELFSAVGTGVYYVAPDWTSTLIGTANFGNGPMKMGDNGTTAVVVDGTSNGWSFDLASHAYAAITDPNFYGSNFVETLDTHLIFNKPGTNIFYLSDSNAITFDPLFFAAKVGYPDAISGIAVQTRNLWLIGAQSSTETWFDAGGADFPFQIMPGPFAEHGNIQTYSIAKQGGSVFWISQDANGTAIVVEASNFSVNRISTPAMENEISTYLFTSDAVGMCFEQRGHPFYWLKFINAGKDWVYDMSTKLWHEMQWLNPNTCENESHRVFCTAFAYGLNVGGDRENGQLYMIDPENPTDAGDFIERRRGWPHLVSDGNRVSYPSFVADIQSGTADTTTSVGIPDNLLTPPSPILAVTVIDTTFTAPDNTLLQNYFQPYGVSEKGSQYTQIDTTINAEVESNALTGAGTGTTSYVASGVPTSPDYIAQFNVVPSSYAAASAAATQIYLIGRADASNNGYQLAVNSDGSIYRLILTVMGAGSTTVDMGLLSGGYFHLFLSMQGSAIDGAVQRSVDGMWLTPAGTWQADFIPAISITDSTYAAKGDVIIGGAWA